MNVLIIEDEVAARRSLNLLVSKYHPSSNIVGEITSIQEGVTWFSKNEAPDVIFMDIELTDGKSFAILEKVEVSSYIIFVTAYDEYAIQAFNFNSINYLLKPIDEEKFALGIVKLEKEINRSNAFPSAELVAQLKEMGQKKAYKNRFLAKRGNKFVSVEATDVAYFCIRNELTSLVTHDNQAFVVNTTLEQLDSQLNPTQFYRLNRQFIANINAIASVENYIKSKLFVKLLPEVADDVIVSQEKASSFKAWLDGV